MGRRRSKYQLPRRKRGGGCLFLGLLLSAAAAWYGWYWWHRPVLVATKAPASVTKPVQAPPPAPLARVVESLAGFPRPVRDVLETQVALARQAISPGSLDGVSGPQTVAALRAFQRRQGLPESGVLDPATRSALVLRLPPLKTAVITSEDLARLQPVSPSWLGKSQQSALDYESVLELVAERTHASPGLIRRLNPGVDWTNLLGGMEVTVPDIVDSPPAEKATFVVISLAEKTIAAFDAATNLLAHFPCSIAARVEKRPVGELHVSVLVPNPNYTFDPAIFPESEEGRQLGQKLIVPPGPNNPVGVAWIGLDQPGYGIHGTPHPEQVGRTESHGCFRLANWNAEYLLKLVWVGMPVYVRL
jgi:lipoprotein-anchoring transpeptidase ErfK/SrfK